VQVDALAASIASVIAMAGDRIIAAPHSQFMIHNAAGVAAGEATELREYADFLDKQSENIAGVYAERAGGTVKHWLRLMAAETWFFADEAVEAGLADEVGKPMRRDDEEMMPDDRAMAAAWDLSVYNYAHTSREEAPAPEVTSAAVEPAPDAEPVAAPVFDPSVFRAAATAALDPMPGYQPEHLRSLMAGVAGDAPAAPAPVRQAAPYVPPPADTMPDTDPQTIAVGYFRSLFAGIANDAPAAPQPQRPTPAIHAPAAAAVPEPPPPAGQVAVDYLRAVMTGIANDAPAPPQTPAPEPTAPEPIQVIDQSAVRRALWEAEL
jgi:hypothetical protein